MQAGEGGREAGQEEEGCDVGERKGRRERKRAAAGAEPVHATPGVAVLPEDATLPIDRRIHPPPLHQFQAVVLRLPVPSGRRGRGVCVSSSNRAEDRTDENEDVTCTEISSSFLPQAARRERLRYPGSSMCYVRTGRFVDIDR